METQASLETITHPHLRKLLAGVADVTTEAQQLRAHLSDSQLAWKPEPDVWNILECLQHVIMVDGLLTMLVAHQQRHLQQAHRLTQRPDFPG